MIIEGAAETTPVRPSKHDDAFLTIGELAGELGIPQHILRYWESRFPQLRPLQRAGNRRYYRPADVALARRIKQLLEHDGYTIKGVQRLLEGKAAEPERASAPAPGHAATPALAASQAPSPIAGDRVDLAALRQVRDRLAAALAAAEA